MEWSAGNVSVGELEVGTPTTPGTLHVLPGASKRLNAGLQLRGNGTVTAEDFTLGDGSAIDVFGTLTLEGDGNILAAAETFADYPVITPVLGTIRKTGGGLSVIQPTLMNIFRGTVEVVQGTLRLDNTGATPSTFLPLFPIKTLNVTEG